MHDEREVRIEPFRGTIKVTFSDAIIASTDNALQVVEEGRDPVYYIPFEDIYFDFLSRTGEETDDAGHGAVAYWDVSAVGQGAREVMWSYDTPPKGLQRLAEHGSFATDKVNVQKEAAPDYEHSVHTP